MRGGDWGDPCDVLIWHESQSCKGCAHIEGRRGSQVCGIGKQYGKRCNTYQEDHQMSKCPAHVREAMFQWGKYSRRPQFWENLSAKNIYGSFPIPRETREVREFFLDPLAARLHRAVMSIDSEKMKGILYTYYVMGINFDDHPEKFKRLQIGRTTFYDQVCQGSIMAFNKAKKY